MTINAPQAAARIREALEAYDAATNGREEVQAICAVMNEANPDALRALLAERDELAEALKPFAEFVFGPMWAGHAIIDREGDSNVMCGYDGEGNTTGIDLMFSDFQRARAALTPKD